MHSAGSHIILIKTTSRINNQENSFGSEALLAKKNSEKVSVSAGKKQIIGVLTGGGD